MITPADKTKSTLSIEPIFSAISTRSLHKIQGSSIYISLIFNVKVSYIYKMFINRVTSSEIYYNHSIKFHVPIFGPTKSVTIVLRQGKKNHNLSTTINSTSIEDQI